MNKRSPCARLQGGHTFTLKVFALKISQNLLKMTRRNN